MDNRIKKLVRRKHILTDGVREIIAAQSEEGINRSKMTLYITQLLFNASQPQTQWLHYHLQQ
jgi:hypothetical protein